MPMPKGVSGKSGATAWLRLLSETAASGAGHIGRGVNIAF